MSATPLKEAILHRKSVRTYDKQPLSAEDRKKLEDYLQTVKNPFGVPVEFKLLDAQEYNLSSPVVVGEDLYLAAKVKKQGPYEVALGYSFEEVCVYAASIGIGTVILAATLSRKTFEIAMDVKDDEVMPIATPVGYAADKRSLRESMMRKGMGSDNRLPFEQLFYHGTFSTPLPVSGAGPFTEALENTRWAPSATNKQPWRAVVIGDTVNFYEAQTLKENTLGDIQKVDVGIAIANFDLTMKEDGYKGEFIDKNPGLDAPENVHYITTYELHQS